MDLEFAQHDLDPEKYKALLRDADAAIEAQIRREFEPRRHRVWDHIHQVWLDLGGSEEAWDALVADALSGSSAARDIRSQDTKHRSPRTNSSAGSRVSQAVIQKYVDDAIADPDLEIVTQTEVKDQVLRDYPDAKVHSVRSAISTRLSELAREGELVLLEQGKAGSPSKYGKPQRSVAPTQTESRNGASESEPDALSL